MPKRSLLFKGNVSCVLKDDLTRQDHETQAATNYKAAEKKLIFKALLRNLDVCQQTKAD